MRKITISFMFFCFFITTKAQGPITDICLVTVDTTSTHNIIVWEKASQISSLPIDSIKIYRTTLLLNDSLIAVVPWTALSVYHDSSANPNLKPYRYRISGVDNAGVEGPKSLPHQTIHFAILEQGDSIRLRWSKYIGQPINFYNCFSDSAGSTPGWQWVNSTANNIDTTWWDKNTPADWTGLGYLVDVNWTNLCSATKAQDHNSTRSNRSTAIGNNPNSPNTTITHEKTIHNLLVYPNPATNKFNIEFSSSAWKPIDIKLMDILGRVVIKHNQIKALGQHKVSLDLSKLDRGVYEVVITTNGEKHSRKIIKQ